MKPYTWLDTVRYQSGLPSQAIHLASVIAGLAHKRRTPPGRPFPMTLEQLSTETGMRSKNTVRRWRDRLEGAGWIERAPQWRAQRQRADLYRLTIPDLMGSTPAPIQPGPMGSTPAPIMGATPTLSMGATPEPRVRSNSIGVDEHGPQSEGEAATTIATPAPDPAQPQAASPDAATQTPRLRITYPERAIPCPSCQAAPGEPCRYRNGRPDSHQQRHTAWRTSA